MTLIPLTIVFEDVLSEFVIEKLAEKLNKFTIVNSYSDGGMGYIKRGIQGFNRAAKYTPFLVLTDLDQTECAPTLVTGWLTEPQCANLIFRVAVKEVEAWLLADIDGFSKFTGVSKANFSKRPDEITDPKAEILRIVSRSRKRELKMDILPMNEFAKVGPNYNDRLGEFVINFWSVNRAIKRSPSLSKAVDHLSRFKLTPFVS